MLKLMRIARMASMVSGLTVAACQQAAHVPGNPSTAPASLPPDVAVKTAGWTAEFLSSDTRPNRHVTYYGLRSLDWDYCLENTAGAWKIDSAKFCPLHDGHHEEIRIDYANRRMLVSADWAPVNFDLQDADDRRLQRNIHCFESTRGEDDYVARHNVCVSAFSKTYIRPASAIGTAITAPFAPIIGRRQYVVEIDRNAIFAAAVTSGAFDQGSERSRTSIVEATKSYTTADPLVKEKEYATDFLALNPDLALQIDQRITTVTAAEQEMHQKQAEADRVAAARQAVLDEQMASAAEKARQAEIVKNKALTAAFRKNLQVGDRSHCGLVLSINRPVAVVQAPAPIGQYGMKISDLYPDGIANCRFYNGVYVSPELPY